MAKAPNLTGMSVAELQALIAQAESAKADAEAREAKRLGLLAEFKRLAGEAGMTPEEVLGGRRQPLRAEMQAGNEGQERALRQPLPLRLVFGSLYGNPQPFAADHPLLDQQPH